MGKPKCSDSGLSAVPSKPAATQQLDTSPADHAAKEERAAERINQGKHQEAELIYEQLIAAGSKNHIVYGNLAAIRGMQNRLDEHIELVKKALQLQPNYPEAHNNLGNALRLQGDLSAAIACLHKALQLKPDYPDAHHNLAIAHQEQGDLAAAIASYNKALELRPGHPEVIWNSSLAMLLGGDYTNGWERYEYRFQGNNKANILYATPACKRWNGEEIAQGSQLLLVSEQGLGDTLQFMRYGVVLARQGISVCLCAPPQLHSLIQASGIDPSPLTPEQANQVDEGQWIPLLSVPRYLKVSPNNPIITEAYIRTTDELIAKWQHLLSAEQRPIIGIHWQGNPDYEKIGCMGRSLPLETFAPIARQANAALLSLQKGFGSEQLAACSFKDQFVSCQDQINETWDFLETAAIIANCDLVITTDTSVAHLAGGMGKPTWLLLKQVPEWRWGLEGDSSFWYPSMRLFRQHQRGDWDAVMEQVAQALHKQFGKSSAPAQPAPAPGPASQAAAFQTIQAPISLGELIDKITILQIKTQHLQGTALENVTKELQALETTLTQLRLNIDPRLIQSLQEVNQCLWQIEDEIRDQERLQNFGENFIRLARSVYQQNDRRAAIKKQINTIYGSVYVEEKCYNSIDQ